MALNPGIYVPIISRSKHEDFTAGEINGKFPVPLDVDPSYRKPIKRFVNRSQFHVLTYLGEEWGSGKPRFPVEFVMEYTKDIVSLGGAITWDLSMKDGVISQECIDQMIEVKKAVR
jgi:hypothetical protein